MRNNGIKTQAVYDEWPESRVIQDGETLILRGEDLDQDRLAAICLAWEMNPAKQRLLRTLQLDGGRLVLTSYPSPSPQGFILHIEVGSSGGQMELDGVKYLFPPCQKQRFFTVLGRELKTDNLVLGEDYSYRPVLPPAPDSFLLPRNVQNVTYLPTCGKDTEDPLQNSSCAPLHQRPLAGGRTRNLRESTLS